MVLGGEDFVLYVETATPGTFIPVADMSRYRGSNARERARYPVFNAAAHRTTGARTKTFSLEGFLNPADAGQNRIRNAENTDTVLKFRVLPDGINGFEITAQVNSTGHEADADDTTLQSFTAECEGTTDPTPYGPSGYIV